MQNMLPPAMIHRPLSLEEHHWRAGFLDTMTKYDPDSTLPVDQAAFVVRITTGLEAEALAEEMAAQNITEQEILDAIAGKVPSSTETLSVDVDRMRVQVRNAQTRLFVNVAPNPVFGEEWRQIGSVLDDLIPGRKVMTEQAAPVPRMQLWQSPDRVMIKSIKKDLDQNTRLTRGPAIELAGIRMGDSEEVIASYQAGIERRVRRAAMMQHPFTLAQLLGWVESSPYSHQEVTQVLVMAEEAGRLAVEEAAEAGLVYQFVD